MKHIKELILEDKKMVDPYFEGARTKIQELAEYFKMDEKELILIIWNGANDNNISEESMELISSMVYSFGLI